MYVLSCDGLTKCWHLIEIIISTAVESRSFHHELHSLGCSVVTARKALRARLIYLRTEKCYRRSNVDFLQKEVTHYQDGAPW